MIIAMNASSLTALVLVLHAIATGALPTQNAATNFQSFRDEPIEMEEAFLRHLDGLEEKLKENASHRLKEISQKQLLHSNGISTEREHNWKNSYFPEGIREQNFHLKKSSRKMPEYMSLEDLRLQTRQDSIGGGNLVRRQDSIGGGNILKDSNLGMHLLDELRNGREESFVRRQDSIGGGNIVRRQDSIGGGNIIKRQDSIGGGNLVRRQDSIGGGNLVRRQDSIGGGNLVRRQDSIGGGNILKDSNLGMYLLDELRNGREESFVRRQDSIGGGNIVRRQDSIGGGNIIKRQDSIGGGNLVRRQDSIGGGNLVRRQDSIGGGNLVRRQDSIGGGNLVRRQDSIGGGNLPMYYNIEMELLDDLAKNQEDIAGEQREI